MTSMGSDAGTVTLTARYSLSTVSVTGTVAVVEPAACAPSERQSARARMSAPVRLAFKCLPPFKEQGRLAPPLGQLRHGIPLDDEDDAGNGGGGDGAGERGHDGLIVHADAVAGAVAHAGHVAAGNRRGDEALGGLVGAGGDLSAAAYAQSEAELVGIDLLTGEGSLVPEGGEVPALSGADADGGDADSAVGVVGDAAVVRGEDIAVLAHGHGQGGGDGDVHGGAGGVSAGAAVGGGAEAYRRGAGAAAGRDVVVRAGADGKGKDEAEGEDEGSGLFELFHVGISPFE